MPLVEAVATARVFVNGPVTTFARSADGTLFVGSHELAAFDGAQWQRVDVPGAKRFLSLSTEMHSDISSHEIRERIWIGALGAIGYLEKDSLGKWSFISLEEPFAKIGIRNIEEIRSTVPTARGAVFIATTQIVRWNGTTFEQWELPSPSRLLAFPVKDDLFIYQAGVGLLRMEANGPKLWLPEKSLPTRSQIAAYLRSPDGTDLAVFSDSIYRRVGEKWIRLDEASAYLKDKRVVRAVSLENGTLVLGTFHDGVIMIAPDGSVQGSVTTHNGLMDDDVHALWPDEMGQVWIGLATGVVRLSGAGAGSWYDHRVGLGSGAVLKVFSHAGRVNVLTSRSVYALVPSTSSEPAHFTRTEKLWPLLRDGVSLDGQLWAGGSGGLWKVNDLTSSQEHKTNGDVYFLATPPSLPHGLLFFENTNIHAWLSSDFTVRDLDLHQTIDDVPSSVAVDKRGHIWVSTLSNRIYEFTWDDLLRRVQLNTEFEQGHGLPRSAGHLKLSTFDNDIVAFTESDILRFDKAANRFATMPLFDPFVGIAVSTPKANHGYWIVRSKILGSDAPYALLKMERTGKELIDFKFTPLDAPGLGQIAEVTSLDITGDGDDELLWIGGSNGLLRLETGSLRSVGTVSPLSLDARRTEESSSSSSHGQNLAHVSEVRRFVFEFQSRSAATGEPIFYQTKLEGAELGWSPPQSTSKREVAGLAPGSYVFDARPIDRFGRIGPSVRYPFTIESPWYLKPMAQSLWAILAALLVWIAVRFRIQRLQRQTEKLNRLVNERTRELTLSSAAKSEFLENISHEIRNPLNGIVGLVDLLDERGLSGKQRQHALSLKECSENLSRIFNDVLEFSKLEYGYAHLEERAFTIDSLLSSVRGVFLATAERQGNTIAIDVPTGFVDGFWGDDGKIRTIVSNFVSNALKYAPATPIVISVSCADAEGNTSKTNEANKVDLIIQVSDLGPGVPLEEQELIFRKFVRGTDAKNSNVPGSGIGLATSHMIAKLLDGNIGIESETGRGSLFFHKCRVARHTFTAAPSSEFQHPALTEGLSVLIVEDQHYNQVVLTGMVSKLGFQVTCAKDANETFAAISKRNFDIVFLDLELPGLKGPDVAQRLRQLACGPSLVLIGASANDTKEAAERSIAAGMDAFLVKPLSLEAIRSTLVSVLARRRTQTLGSVDLDFGSLELYATNVAGSMAKSVRIYLDILGKELDALRDAVLREHAKDILLTAHRLSSHASLVKAAELRRFLLELERGARLGQIANSRELLQEITESVAVVELKLTAKISSSVPESV